ncbi:hypothetical protein ACA910_018976 [Epithemia clementina (nom. ined.)]
MISKCTGATYVNGLGNEGVGGSTSINGSTNNDKEPMTTSSAVAQLNEQIAKLKLELAGANKKVESRTTRINNAGVIITKSVRALQEKDREMIKLAADKRELQEQNKTLQRENNDVKEELAAVTTELETYSAKLSDKEKQICNQNAQVLHHWKRCKEVEETMHNNALNLPKSASTWNNALQNVETIYTILETRTT